jgi:UDP-N-acetylglucosamine--N-acetylmuramyl-(pentapeptide) pyrophosphoryl-undecaprenol N-acetylglucosamine transferase
MLAVVQAVRSLSSREVEATHLGTRAAVEQRILASAGIPSRELAVSGLRGSNPARFARNALRMAAAVRPAAEAVKAFRPDVVFTTGGYVSAPVVAAARLRRVPALLFSADVSAGLAIRFEARLAQRIAVPVEQAARSLPPDRTFVSGYPIRPGLERLPAKAEAKRSLGFDPQRALLLCFGGSQGAQTLNDAIAVGLEQLLPATQVLHLCGSFDFEWLQALEQPGYRVHAFLDDMPAALAAADLAVSRSGASTLGELPAAGLPAILVPYPYAGGHQKHNARVLADAGGAVLLDNEAARAGKLAPLALTLLGNPERLAAMSAAMRSLSRPEAAQNIAQALLELAA